jgi:hypothetical protein
MMLTVTTTMISRKTDQNMWFILEVDFETIDDVYEALAEDGMIVGDRIDTMRQGSRTVEREREEIIVGANIVGTIKPCHIDFEVSANPTYSGRGQV